jgi:hypothetical protein
LMLPAYDDASSLRSSFTNPHVGYSAGLGISEYACPTRLVL